MGSFYSTCSISHMTLTHQKTSIQLLVPTYKPDFKDHMGMMTFNEGSMGFFSPFGFPIHGRYDDYGYLHDIQEDKTTKMLEEFFNISIDQIIQNVGDDRWYDIGEVRNDDSWKIQNEDGTPMKNQKIFRQLGMTYIRTEIMEHLERGWEKYVPTGGQLKQYSGERMISHLIHTLKTHKIVSPKITSQKVLDKLIESLDSQDWSDEDKKDFIERQKYQRDTSFSHDNCYMPSLVKVNMYEKLPITPDFTTEICKQYQLIRSLSELRRLFLPSLYGSQYTNYKSTFELNELSNKLMEKDVIENLKDEIESWEKYEKKGGMPLEEHLNEYDGLLETYKKFKHLL